MLYVYLTGVWKVEYYYSKYEKYYISISLHQNVSSSFMEQIRYFLESIWKKYEDVPTFESPMISVAKLFFSEKASDVAGKQRLVFT